MQTFITSLDLEQSAHSLWESGVLGNRLQNQINEALIILRTLTGWYAERDRKGWPHHPATKMWAGYEAYLTDYIEFHIRKYAELSGNDCSQRYDDLHDVGDYNNLATVPRWLTEEFASNHRSILLGKVKEADEIAFDSWVFNYPDQKLYKKFEKAEKVYKWYQSLGWTEETAVKVDGKWPYLWPE